MNKAEASKKDFLFYLTNQKLTTVFVFGFICIYSVFLFSYAIVGKAASSAEFTQSYATTTDIASGAIVSLTQGKTDTVEIATLANAFQMVGVYVEKGESLAEVNSGNTGSVATSGRALALVSDIYGDIKSGDALVLSVINGVAAKTTYGALVVGVAQADFNSQTTDTTTQDVTKNDGTVQKVKVGTIPIVVSIGGVPAGAKDTGIKGVFNSIAGKNVSDIRLALCIFVAILVIVVLAVLISSSIKSGIISVGRNPKAKISIFEALAQVMVMVVLVAILGVTIMYAILRL